MPCRVCGRILKSVSTDAAAATSKHYNRYGGLSKSALFLVAGQKGKERELLPIGARQILRAFGNDPSAAFFISALVVTFSAVCAYGAFADAFARGNRLDCHGGGVLFRFFVS